MEEKICYIWRCPRRAVASVRGIYLCEEHLKELSEGFRTVEPKKKGK